MPLNLSNAAIQQFKLQFELEYQAVEKLSNTTQTVMNCRGDAYKVPYMGEILSTARGAYQSLLQPEDMDIKQAVINFQNWSTMTALDIFQNHEVAGDTLASLAATHAKSTGRRVDQTKIDAMETDHGEHIAAGATNLTTDKISEAKAMMDEANVTGERFLIVSPHQIESLFTEDQVTNVLYNSQRVLVDGNLDTFLGFKIITLGNYPEGGLPYDAATKTRSCFAWSKSALWTAFQMSPSVDAQWSASHQSWLQVSRVRLGATVAQDTGCVMIDCDETPPAP